MNQNIGLYKNEHIVLTLRVLARLIKSSNASQVESLNKDERYRALTTKAQENLEEFNEYEILDFLFWLRRFKNGRLPTHVTEESLSKLFSKVRDFVKSKSFNFRNLVNLYYDLSSLNKNTDDIAGEILNELKADFKLLTPFTIVQILQAASRKNGYASPQEYQVADYVQKNLGTMLQEFDSDQKCLVFKYLSALEMHINPPKYRVPGILYKIKSDLKEILDQLSELGVINILEAYSGLPREFPSDLLDEIKEMVIVTIQHNSENIKSFFLIDFLDKILNLSRGRKPTEDKIIVIYEEITKRILNDEYTSRFKTLERLLEIYEKAGIQYEPLLDKIIQRISEYQGTFFSGPILKCLNRNGKDVSPIVDKYIENSELTKLSAAQRFQLFLLLTELKTDKYQTILEELKAQLLETPEIISKLITHIPISYNKNLEEVFDGIIEYCQKNKETINSFNFFRIMHLTTVNRKTRQAWMDWAKDNLNQLTKSETNKFIEVFFNLQDVTIDRILLFTSVIERVPDESLSFKRLLSSMKENKQILIEFSRLEAKFQKFLVRILRLMTVDSKEVRLATIYSFLKRVENVGIKSPIIPLIAKKGFELTKSSNVPINANLELLYGLYLIGQRSLRVEYAQQIYEKIKNDSDIYLVSKVFAYIVQRSPASDLEKPEIKAEINNKLEALQKNLSETGARTVLTSLAHILAFPPEFLEPNRELYVKSIKSFLNFGNSHLYMNIIHSLYPNYVRNSYDFYVPIIRELITNYNNFNKRLNPSELVNILTKFSECNTRNPTIYNHILSDIGRLFNALKNDELSDVVVAFTKIRIKQTDLFDKILSKIVSYPTNFATNIKFIFSSFFKVGFNSPQAKASIAEIYKKSGKSSATALAFANYISILNIENEAELFEEVLANLTPEFSQRYKHDLFNLEEYLRIVHKDKPHFAETVKNLIPEYEELKAKISTESKTLSKAKKLIGDYLSIMKIDYQTDFSVDGYSIDLYIPDKKNLIKIFTHNDVNFDKISLSGRALQTRTIYQTFEGYTTTFVNFAEFKSIPENMNKINHLIALGIENNNHEGTYDFSRVIQEKEFKEEDFAEEIEKEEEVEIEEEAIVEEVEAVKEQN